MAGTTASSDITRPGVDLPEQPLRGQIWAAQLSAVLHVLQAAAACSVAGLSVAMQTDKDKLENAGSSPPTRPCIIMRTNSETKTATVLVFTTLGYGLTDIQEMNQYFQHFAVAVGDTAPWPLETSWTLQTEPLWRTVPQYLVAFPHQVPYSTLLRRYRANASGPPIYYQCDSMSMMKLTRICTSKTASLQAKRASELKKLDKSYVDSKELYTSRRAASEQLRSSFALRTPYSSLGLMKHGIQQPRSRVPAVPPPPSPASPPRAEPSRASGTPARAVSGHRRAQSVTSVVAPNPWAMLPIDEGEDAPPPLQAADSASRGPSPVPSLATPAPVPSLSTTPDSSSCDSSPREIPRSVESSPTQPLLDVEADAPSRSSEAAIPHSFIDKSRTDDLRKTDDTNPENEKDEPWLVVSHARRKSQDMGLALREFSGGRTFYIKAYTHRADAKGTRSGAMLFATPRTVF